MLGVVRTDNPSVLSCSLGSRDWVFVPKQCLEQVITLPVVSVCTKYALNCVKKGFQMTGLGSSWYKLVTTEQPQCFGGSPRNIRQLCAVLFLGKLSIKLAGIMDFGVRSII